MSFASFIGGVMGITGYVALYISPIAMPVQNVQHNPYALYNADQSNIQYIDEIPGRAELDRMLNYSNLEQLEAADDYTEALDTANDIGSEIVGGEGSAKQSAEEYKEEAEFASYDAEYSQGPPDDPEKKQREELAREMEELEKAYDEEMQRESEEEKEREKLKMETEKEIETEVEKEKEKADEEAESEIKKQEEEYKENIKQQEEELKKQEVENKERMEKEAAERQKAAEEYKEKIEQEAKNRQKEAEKQNEQEQDNDMSM